MSPLVFCSPYSLKITEIFLLQKGGKEGGRKRSLQIEKCLNFWLCFLLAKEMSDQYESQSQRFSDTHHGLQKTLSDGVSLLMRFYIFSPLFKKYLYFRDSVLDFLIDVCWEFCFGLVVTGGWCTVSNIYLFRLFCCSLRSALISLFFHNSFRFESHDFVRSSNAF